MAESIFVWLNKNIYRKGAGITLAYAMTVHKAQGSEYDSIYLPSGCKQAHAEKEHTLYIIYPWKEYSSIFQLLNGIEQGYFKMKGTLVSVQGLSAGRVERRI